ncbi:MAG: hypothetical protein R3F14_26885 [Polyangiaceae bacterium]
MKTALSVLLLHLGSLASLPETLDDPPVPPVAPRVPLSIAIAGEEGAPVQTPQWLSAQLAEVQRIYNGFGVYFRKAETRALDERFARLESRGDRDALADQIHKGFLNVFVVRSLRDVDDDSLYRMGVHWAPRGDLKRQYIIVASTARVSTMAHEIGHYFRLQHSFVQDNLMSYQRSGLTVFLDAKQKATVIANAKSLFSRKELVP